MSLSARTVAVTLKANVSDYIGNLGKAAQATKDFGTSAGKSATEHSAAWGKVGTLSVGVGVGLTAALGSAVKAFASFDQAMSGVKAVSNATAGDMDKLRAAALKAGADTKFSATEAATAEGELAKVGISASDILGGALSGSLSLAAAGQLDLGRAAEVSGNAMKIFNLQGKDVGHIADVMAAGANKSAADVESLAQALSQGGQVAAQTGMSLEETVGVLSAFADNALQGSDAGTSLKTMLQRLTPQSKEAANLMDQLNLHAYDASGQFVGLSTYAGMLQNSLRGMTAEQRNAAMATLFGSDAVRAANVLYTQGAAGIQTYIAGVNDQGAASRVAATNMDNLAGDLENLQGSLETALIGAGSHANGVLRDMTQFATGAVNAFADLPGPVQETAVVLAAVGAAAALIGGGLLLVIPRIAETKRAIMELRGVGAGSKDDLEQIGSSTSDAADEAGGAMDDLKDTATDSLQKIAEKSEGSSGKLAKIGVAAGKAAAAFGAFEAAAAVLGSVIDMGQNAALSVDKTTTALLALGNSGGMSMQDIDKAFQGLSNMNEDDIQGMTDALHRLTDPDWNQKLNKIASGLTFGHLGTGDEGITKQFDAIGRSLAAMVQSGNSDKAASIFKMLADNVTAAGGSVDDLKDKLPAYTDALAAVDNQQQLSATSTSALATASDTAAAALGISSRELKTGAEAAIAHAAAIQEDQKRAEAAKVALQGLTDSLEASNNKFLAGRGAARSWYEALDDAKKALKDNGKTLDEHTAKGRENEAALDKLANEGLARLQQKLADKGPGNEFKATLAETRSGLIKTYLQFDNNIGRAGAYADKILAIPAKKATEIELNGIAEAAREVAAFAESVALLHGKTVTIDMVTIQRTRQERIAMAGGGLIGMGRGAVAGRDSVPAMLMPGEVVLRKPAVDRIGVSNALHLNATGQLPSSALAAKQMAALPHPPAGGRGTANGLPAFADGGFVARAMASTASTVVPQQIHEGDTITIQAVDVDDAVRRLTWERAKLTAIRGGN